jgi:hypothetical protein
MFLYQPSHELVPMYYLPFYAFSLSTAPHSSPHADRRGFDALSEYSPDILDKYLNRSKFDNPLIYRQLKGITAPLQALSTAVEGGSTTTTLQTQRMQGTLRQP